jgi:Uma2 family endonuclease
MNLITTRPELPKPGGTVPPLRNGERLTRAEFERRYDAMPGLKKAELIDGGVYLPPPVTDDHSGSHAALMAWLGRYGAYTPGVAARIAGSVRLELDSMPQPDVFLRILETHGGQSYVGPDRYIEGAPELVAEIAVSSVEIDLDLKLPLYARNKVREYLVWRVADRQIDWFVLRGPTYARSRPTTAGVYRSRVFRGLWLDAAALLEGDLPKVLALVQQGVNSPEHAAFVQKLERKAARKRS